MYHRLFALCFSLCLTLSACKTQGSAFVPVTGEKSVAVPAQVEQAHASVLKYAVSSARITSLPRHAKWELETGRQSEKEYRYHSGEWLIVIRQADTKDGNRQVMILNQAEHVCWTGYVDADGDVVDTYYAR